MYGHGQGLPQDHAEAVEEIPQVLNRYPARQRIFQQDLALPIPLSPDRIAPIYSPHDLLSQPDYRMRIRVRSLMAQTRSADEHHERRVTEVKQT
jgi:hypothetical protein